MNFTWNESKRQANLTKHGLDFADAAAVFALDTFTFEDQRFAYGEHRFITLGLLGVTVVVVVHTETDTFLLTFVNCDNLIRDRRCRVYLPRHEKNTSCS
ncbi:BrnT family toxin, partial [Chromatium okenii]|uniref:BrnT family toxin n=1 Tax=Chromatium okenii TaxID=61644 RepID=UPI0026F278B1